VSFTPTSEKLIPDLSPRDELAMLCRTLWAYGYSDHLAGHITHNLGDGTFLVNPWYLTWDEVYSSQISRMDSEGNLLEGDWPVPPGIPLHLALHRLRPGVGWAMHNHPLFGTLWADLAEVPPAMDQSSAAGGGEIRVVDEYKGAVADMSAAESAVRALEDADIGLLRGHGVFVLGNSARAIFQRSIALEIRCQRAWYLRCAGASLESPVPESWMERQRNSNGEGTRGYWETSIRRALRQEPDFLDR
jgi:ribulose-5-phosphate 4-epimerase/fuculose-1-phosphate aldolase